MKMDHNNIPDSQMSYYLTNGCGRITEHKWNDVEESNAGTIAVLDRSAGVDGWAAGTWMADGRSGWNRI